MALTVGEVEKLDEKIRDSGQLALKSLDKFLADINTWFDFQVSQSRVLGRQSFAYLREEIRTPRDRVTLVTAVGTLELVREYSESSPDRARFVARFGIRRLAAMTKRPLRWAEVSIPESDSSEARQLFELELGGSSVADEHLVSQALSFAEEHESSFDMFGRFAQDLELLADVLSDPDASSANQETARAALAYFVEVDDAIPDDLGPVGLLDDAIVARTAIEEIKPGRSVLSQFLDKTIEDWPFLLNLALDDSGEEHPFSEFAIVNAALLLSGTNRDSDLGGTMVVGPDPGPLSFVAGFVRALGEVRKLVQSADAVVYESGERLSSREPGQSEVEFVGYGTLDGTNWVESAPESATHFKVRLPGKRGGSPVERMNDIANLASLRRSGRRSGRLRSGHVRLDRGSTRLGALEQLFGVTDPIQLPADRACVIVVAPIGSCESLARSLTLGGVPLCEILPMASARVQDDQMEVRTWTNRGPGGEPMLLVVRSFPEAVEIAESAESPPVAVVGECRREGADAGPLGRLASGGIQVLAFSREGDQETEEAMSGERFDFWSWDAEWLSNLRWPEPPNDDSRHALATYEERVRRCSTARINVVSVDDPAIDRAYAALSDLGRHSKGKDDELLAMTASAGFITLLRVLGCLSEDLDEAKVALRDFRVNAESGKRFWREDEVEAIELALSHLDTAIKSLEARNTKREAILTWGTRNRDGVVIARGGKKNLQARTPESSHLRWMTSSGRIDMGEPVLIPAWIRKTTMERLLVPPVSSAVTLCLYGPEREWYDAMRSRRQRARQRVRKLVARRPSIPLSGSHGASSEPIIEEPTIDVPDVDMVVDRGRRAHVLRSIESPETELADARLVFFVGGHWAAFAPKRRVNRVSHPSPSISSGDEEAELDQVEVGALKQGDQILMVRGSDRDVLRHAADAELEPGMRHQSAEWKRALERFALAGNSPRVLHRALAEEGCKRTLQTIRLWLHDDTLIGPMDRSGDVLDAICRITRDPELEQNLTACKEAIVTVRRKHLEVAHRLARRVLERAAEWLEIDAQPDELVEVEERLVILSVESVDPETVEVPRTVLNRLKEVE